MQTEEGTELPEYLPIEKGLPSEKLTVHKDALGMMIAKKRSHRFIFDPPTGNFRISGMKGDMLSGIVLTGRFEKPSIFIKSEPKDEIYGFGAATGNVDRNNSAFELINRDTRFGERSGAVSASFPFFIIRRSSTFYGVFFAATGPVLVNSSTSSSSPDGPGVKLTLNLPHAGIDVFIFSGTLPEILNQFTRITGRPALLPIWALGYHYSRRKCRDEGELLSTVEKIRLAHLPCDSIHISENLINRYSATGFDPNGYPARLNDLLKSEEIHSLASVDAAVIHDVQSELYRDGVDHDAFCKNSLGEDYIGRGATGPILFPDFTSERVRTWWTGRLKNFIDSGFSGIVHTGNEPNLQRSGRGEKEEFTENILFEQGSHRDVRNVYARYQVAATSGACKRYLSGERPFLITEGGSPGIQKYGALYSGACRMSWKHLRMSLHNTLNIGLSGEPYVLADAGGSSFGWGLRDLLRLTKQRELFLRWIELHSLMPLFRTHAFAPLNIGELWGYGEETLGLIRKQVNRRHQLMHYFYNLMFNAHLTGEPIIRPLFYHFPETTHRLARDQFMVGDALLAAPIFRATVMQREVYLPEGSWTDFETGVKYEGGKTHRLASEPGTYPFFVRSGSILPLCEAKPNALRSVQSGLILEMAPDNKMEARIRLDDGITNEALAGNILELFVTAKRDRPGNLLMDLSITKNNFTPDFSTIRIRLPIGYKHMILNGKHYDAEEQHLASEQRKLSMSVFEIPIRSLHAEFMYRPGWTV
jgi:alpha-glucosidase